LLRRLKHCHQYSQQPYSFRISSRRESDFARLEQLLREADERIKQERNRAEEADKRAELERRRAEDEQRNRQEAGSRAQTEEKKTRPTTFEEYIRACHILLSKPLRIQTDKNLGTQGSITSPDNQALPDSVEALGGLSSAAATALRKNLRIHPHETQHFSAPLSTALSSGRTSATDYWRARRIWRHISA
jgi:hypothetical protein